MTLPPDEIAFFAGLCALLGAGLGLWRGSAPLLFGGVAGPLWAAIGLLLTGVGGGAAPIRAGVAEGLAMAAVPVTAVWAWVTILQRREAEALAAMGTRRAAGRWDLRVGATHVAVERVITGRPVRFVDASGHVFSTPLPLKGAWIEPRRRGDPGPWRYRGPRDLPGVWLAGDVPDRLGDLLDDHGARVEDGVLRVQTAAWLDEPAIRSLLGEIEVVVQAVRASGRDAIGRLQAQALGAGEAVARADAWRTLADEIAEGVAAIAARGLDDPDPVIRAIAARQVGDRAVIAAILARSDDADAVRRATEAVVARGWVDLADDLAARVGVPPEGVWPDLIDALGALGGRAHMARLQEVADGVGYGSALQVAALRAMAGIRARLGTDAVGRVALSAGEGGEVALAPEPGRVAVAASEGDAENPRSPAGSRLRSRA